MTQYWYKLQIHCYHLHWNCYTGSVSGSLDLETSFWRNSGLCQQPGYPSLWIMCQQLSLGAKSGCSGLCSPLSQWVTIVPFPWKNAKYVKIFSLSLSLVLPMSISTANIYSLSSQSILVFQQHKSASKTTSQFTSMINCEKYLYIRWTFSLTCNKYAPPPPRRPNYTNMSFW